MCSLSFDFKSLMQIFFQTISSFNYRDADNVQHRKNQHNWKRLFMTVELQLFMCKDTLIHQQILILLWKIYIRFWNVACKCPRKNKFDPKSFKLKRPPEIHDSGGCFMKNVIN